MRHFFSSFAVLSALVTALTSSMTITEPSGPVLAQRTLRTEGGTITSDEQGTDPILDTSTLAEAETSIQEERRNGFLMIVNWIKNNFKDIVSFSKRKGIDMSTGIKKLHTSSHAKGKKGTIRANGFLKKLKIAV
uniref:RxLR effector candidate protein n=1 Tax=Hyaloperonospora arabidopsidis (strain Emoy2) TaxID=559515 RepID=M4C5Y9_HYAAE|nr:RxLR effector candidate protein [Hyaloperonospora arabidopsidis Emoy2]